jgi:hypothetical protein
VIDSETSEVFNSKINQRFRKENKEEQIKRKPVNIRIEKYIIADFSDKQNSDNKKQKMN